MLSGVSMKEEIKERAYAKVNIGLDVTGIREDGYHLLDTVMHTIDLYDDVTVRRSSSGGISVSANDPAIDTGEKNLMRRAAELIMGEAGLDEGLEIVLDARIPTRAGMGGGSADAAAVLRAVNGLFDLGYSVHRLRRMAVRLGADVPFQVTGGTARCTGIGEIIEELPDVTGGYIAVVKPRRGIDTPFVFKELDREILPQSVHPNMDEVVAYIHAGEVRHMSEAMGNILERVTVREVPEVGEIKKLMMSSGALGSLMTGSGTTVFGIFESRDRAEACVGKITDAEICTVVGLSVQDSSAPGAQR